MLQNSVIDGKLNSNVWLERVNLYRYPSKPSRIEAVVANEIGVTLTFKYDPESKLLVIRKPELMMAKNWQIIIT